MPCEWLYVGTNWNHVLSSIQLPYAINIDGNADLYTCIRLIRDQSLKFKMSFINGLHTTIKDIFLDDIRTENTT